jgi:hypothetical protein
MKAKKMAIRQRKYSYPKLPLLRTTFEFVIIIVGMMLILAFINAPLEWLLFFLLILLVMLLVLGISPLITSHTLTNRRLIIRQGWHLKIELMLGNIENIEPMEGGLKGFVSAPGRTALYVTSTKFDQVSIKLKKPIRLIFALGKLIDEVIICVENRNKFIEDVKGAVQSLQSRPRVRNPSLGM